MFSLHGMPPSTFFPSPTLFFSSFQPSFQHLPLFFPFYPWCFPWFFPPQTKLVFSILCVPKELWSLVFITLCKHYFFISDTLKRWSTISTRPSSQECLEHGMHSVKVDETMMLNGRKIRWRIQGIVSTWLKYQVHTRIYGWKDKSYTVGLKCESHSMLNSERYWKVLTTGMLRLEH